MGLTLDFGGAAFGLQAFLTTFSNEDIVSGQAFFTWLCTLTPDDGRLTTVTWSGSWVPPRNHFPFMEMLPQKRLAAGLGSGAVALRTQFS